MSNNEIIPSKAQNRLQMIKFTLFSISAGVIQIIVFTLLSEIIKFKYWPAYLIALVMSVVYNFTINRRYTFMSATNYPLAMAKLIGYYLVFTPLSTWWGDALTFIGWNEYIVLLGTMAINLITEFLFCRFLIYKGTMYTNELGKKALEKATS